MKIIIKIAEVEVSYEESLRTKIEMDKDMISLCSEKALELYFETRRNNGMKCESDVEGDRGWQNTEI